MNRVDTSDEFRRSGRSLVTDAPGRRTLPTRYDEPPVSPGQPIEPFDFDAAEDPRDLIALRGRITAGLGIQLLLDRLTNETFITVALNGETETFPVLPEHANDAFEHPFAYGATLPL